MKPLEPIPTTLRVRCDLLYPGVWIGQKARAGLTVYVFSSSGLKDHVWTCNVNQSQTIVKKKRKKKGKLSQLLRIFFNQLHSLCLHKCMYDDFSLSLSSHWDAVHQHLVQQR